MNHKNNHFQLLLLITLLSWQALPAQVLVNLAWEQGNGAPSSSIDYSVSALDANGNLVVAGNTINGTEAENFLITKFDPEGQILWEEQYDYSDLTDFATAIAIDGNGNVLVAGASQNGTLDFDYALLKLDGNGSTLWSVRYDGLGQGDDIPTGIALDSNGNIYLTGVSQGDSTQQDFATVKYSSSGVQQWVARYDYAQLPDAAAGILVDEAHQQVIVSGASAANATDWDVATLRYSLSTGAALSVARQASGASSFTEPIALTQDGQGHFLITGTATGPTGTDIQIIKLDTALNIEWVQTYDASSLDGGRDVAVDAHGDIYVCGYRQTEAGMAFQLLKYDEVGTLLWQQSREGKEPTDSARAVYLSLDAEGQVYVSGDVGQVGGGSYLMTLLYDPEGQLLWETFYDDPSREEVPADLRADLFGVVYLTGKSQSGGSGQYLTLKYEVMPLAPQVVLGPTGKASHVAHEVLIRFDPSVVDPAFVDNRELNFGRVDEIITDPALISLMDSKLQANGQLGSWTLSRVFHSLDTQDETMTSVLGKTVELPKLWSALRLHLPAVAARSLMDEHEVADSLSTLPLRYLRYAHPNYSLHLNACAPNDPLYGSQLSLDNSDTARTHINAEQAWCLLDSTDQPKGRPSIRVGVFDTGLDADHPDFVFGGGAGYAGSVVDMGRRFLNGSQTTLQYGDPDLQGHGSKSAGIVAAIRNNGTGIAGIAGGDVGKGEGEGVHLVNLQTFFPDVLGGTSANIADLVDAFTWGLTAGPNGSPAFQLANHGYGFYLDDIQVSQPNVDLFREVWQTAFRAEVTSVVSRGNAFQADPTAASSLPATFTIDSVQEPSFYFDDWNLSVGASDERGNLARWQNPGNPDPFSSYYSKSVDLIAPGISTYLETTNDQGGYSDFNGTSASAPHVVGAAALLMSYSDVPLAPEDVERLLQYGAVPKSTMDSTGWGMLDAYASLKLIEQPEYRVMHFDTVLTGGGIQVAPSTITIRLTADYDTIEAGIYQAVPYQHVATFSYDLGPGASLATLPPNKPPYWIRNSGSRLWGPNGTLVGGTGQYVVPVDRASFFSLPTASSATVSGYYYEVLLSPSESVVIPYGADTSARVAFSLLAYNPEGFPTSLEEAISPEALRLSLFPNPSSDQTSLTYELASSQPVRMQLLDASGRCVWRRPSMHMVAGVHQQVIPTASLPAGLYVLRLQAGVQSSSVKLIKQ